MSVVAASPPCAAGCRLEVDEAVGAALLLAEMLPNTTFIQRMRAMVDLDLLPDMVQ
jgi:hypothetical protein